MALFSICWLRTSVAANVLEDGTKIAMWKRLVNEVKRNSSTWMYTFQISFYIFIFKIWLCVL